MVGIGILILGVLIIFSALIFMKEANFTRWLARKGKTAINHRDLANWFKLNLSSMGGLLFFVGVVSFFFRDKNPWIFVGLGAFVILIFAGLLRMGYQLLVKEEAALDK